MLVQLQPVQISLLWDDIKHSVSNTTDIPVGKTEEYFSGLLANLLSGKFQCWVVYSLVDNVRKLSAIGITALVDDKLFGVKNLHILSLYGYRRLTDELMVTSLQKLKDYATSEHCVNITLSTNIDRIKTLSKLAGFSSTSVNYSLQLGD